MALPTATTHQDRLLTVNIHQEPVMPGDVSLTPLFLDPENGVWVMYGRFAPGTVLPTHYHTGTVHFFTTKGQWNYTEYPDDPQVAGSYLFEPGGSIHSFSVPADASEPAEGFFVVNGANVNFVDGAYQDITDAVSLEGMLQAMVKSGVMASMPRYIRPGAGAGFSVGSGDAQEAGA